MEQAKAASVVIRDRYGRAVGSYDIGANETAVINLKGNEFENEESSDEELEDGQYLQE